MKCPECGAHSFVMQTRNLIDRRRECYNGHRFSTVEVVRDAIRSDDRRLARRPTVPKSNDRSPQGNTPCRRRGCTGTLRPGKAMWPTFVGTPDFPLDKEIATIHEGGPGRLVDCMKCGVCGFSTT
jgi:hypothetical protein